MKHINHLWPALVAVPVLLFLFGTPHASRVEIDLDGELGNGPDTMEVAVGDFVDASIWFVGGEDAAMSFNTIICADSALDYHSTVYETPSCMTTYPPEFPLPDCVSLAATDFCFSCYYQPFELATVTYQAITEDFPVALEVDLANSSYFSCEIFESVTPDSTVDAYVRILPTTSTGRSSWGSVKALFR